MTAWLVLIVTVAVALLAAVLVWRRVRRFYEAWTLFRQALRGQELTPRQRALLVQMAGDLRLAHPILLLLSPALLRKYVAAWKALRGSRKTISEEDVAEIERRGNLT